MKRIAEDHLKSWYLATNRMPLIIRGARQVGKSTLVRLFCERNSIDLIEINLERTRLKVLDGEFTINELLDEIQLKANKKITDSTLIFFDEIQESPKLLKSLRYFFEEVPSIPIVCAGSLLEVAFRKEDFSFPVGRVEFYNLGPMTFIEFLMATGKDLLAKKIIDFDFSDATHELAIKELIKFYYIGGMPKAVKTYVESKSLVPVRAIQTQIIETYLADFPKYNNRIRVDRVERVFYTCASYIGKKMIYQKLDPLSQSREIRRIIELLIDARVILKCVHTHATDSPLMGGVDESVMKIYFLDIGLLNSLLRLDLETIGEEFENQFNVKGVLAEQFIAQHLAYEDPSQTPRLFYWLRDKGLQKGEIDFILESGISAIPVEVKATSAGHLKSLFYYTKEKKIKNSIKISLEKYSVTEPKHKIDGEFISTRLATIPQYSVSGIHKNLKKIFP